MATLEDSLSGDCLHEFSLDQIDSLLAGARSDLTYDLNFRLILVDKHTRHRLTGPLVFGKAAGSGGWSLLIVFTCSQAEFRCNDSND